MPPSLAGISQVLGGEFRMLFPAQDGGAEWRAVMFLCCRRRRETARITECNQVGAVSLGPRAGALTLFLTLHAREGADGQAVVCPLLRVARQREGSRQNSIGSLALTHLHTLIRARGFS